MRKLLLLIATAAVAMALAAPAASALTWHGVTVDNGAGTPCHPTNGCSFDTGTQAWGVDFPSYFTLSSDTCQARLVGRIFPDGAVEVTAVEISGGLGSQKPCEYLEATDLPWTGEVCMNEVTGRTHIGLNNHLRHQGPAPSPAIDIDGPAFGKLTDSSGGYTGIENIQYGSGSGSYVQLGIDDKGGVWGHQGDFPVTPMIAEPAGGCPWPGLNF